MTTKGILVQLGLVDSDYQGEVKIMLRALGYCIIPAQTYVAQLLLIPYKVPNTQEVARGEHGFGSTNNKSIFWTASINLKKLILKIKVKDREFHGLLDTGADVSVISSQYWPPEWLLTKTDISITGIGGISQPRKSTWTLKCFGPDGWVGQIRPYILPTPLNIWGRDLLTQWGVRITLPPFP